VELGGSRLRLSAEKPLEAVLTKDYETYHSLSELGGLAFLPSEISGVNSYEQ